MRNIAITRTGQDGLITLTCRFKSISQLLDEEDSTLLPDKELTGLAEETLAEYLDEYMVKRDLRLVLALPEKDLPADADTIIPEAVRRHFSFHTQDIRHEIIISWREGMYSLYISLANAIVAIFILYLLSIYGINIESFPAVILVGFITILNWVTTWDTYEHFVYDHRALWRKERIYEKISRMPISVEGY